ncbi:MAG: Spy/CpxP family protein refolding chaperone [Blastocatellia bacterium]
MSKLSKIQTTAIAFVMAIAVAVPVATAQSTDDGAKRERHGQWHERGMRGDGRMMGFGGLDLTDAQKAQMKQIRESHSQSVRPLMEQIRAKRQEIHQASEGGSFNEALVAQKLTEIAPLEAKLMGEQFRIRQEMLSVLTPEQKAKLDQSREHFKSRSAARRAGRQPKTQ